MERYYSETLKRNGLVGGNDEVLRALIIIDSICCKMVYNRERSNTWWTTLNKELSVLSWSDPNNINVVVEDVLKNTRKYFYLLLKGHTINSFANSFRITVHTYLLYLISTQVVNREWKEGIENYTSELKPSWHRKIRNEIIDVYIDNYWNIKKSLSEADFIKIEELGKVFKVISREMKKILISVHNLDQGNIIDNSQPIQRYLGTPHYFKEKKPFVNLQSKENRIQLQCMIEEYLSINSNSTENGWNQYLVNNWEKYFPEVELSTGMQLEIKELLGLGQEHNSRTRGNIANYKRYFKALGIVICNGNIQKIRSESVIRSLVLNRTVAMTVSLLDYTKADKKNPEEVTQDILAYLSFINYVTNKAEEDDIVESLGLFIENGRFTAASIKTISQHYEMWKKSFNEMKEYLNGRNKVVSVLNDKIDEMESSLAKASYNTLKRFVIDLDRGDFGYQLGKLYRFSIGMDSLTIDEVRKLVCTYFGQLNNMGIKPIATDLLNSELDVNDDIYTLCIPYSLDQSIGSRILVYPGWTVNGSVVASPVYQIKENK